MADPFSQFGGQAEQSSGNTDPFTQFGGSATPPPTQAVQQEQAPQDPFAQFGGQAHTTTNPPPPRETLPNGSKSWSESGDITNDELANISKKYNVPQDKLMEDAPYFGITVQGMEPSLKQKAGAALNAIYFGGPAWLAKKVAGYNDPDYKNALDELRDLAESKKSTLQKGTEVVAGLAAPVANIGGGIAGAAATGGLIGGVQGLTGSREGEELSGTAKGVAVGATVGTIFGAGAEGLSKLLSSTTRLGPIEQKIIRTQQHDIEQGVQQIAQKTEKSENLISEVMNEGRENLEKPEIDSIVQEQLDPETVQKALDPSTSEGKLIREKIGNPDASPDVIQSQLAQDVIEDRIRSFAEKLSGQAPEDLGSAIGMIRKIESREGEEAVANRYALYTQGEQAERYIQENALIAKDQPGFFGRTANKLSDNQYVLRHLDDKYGTKTEEALQDLNKGNNRYSFVRQEIRKDSDEIGEFARDNGSDPVTAAKSNNPIFKAVDTGNFEGLSTAERDTAYKFKEEFEKVWDLATEGISSRDPNIAPLNIPKLENYVPHIQKPTEEILSIMEDKISEAQQSLSEMFDRPIKSFAELRPQEYKQAVSSGTLDDILKFTSWTEADKHIPDGRSLQDAINTKLYTREGNIGLESMARATQERQGQIPDFLLEQNMYKLLDQWSLNTFKHLYMRNALDKLNLEATKLDKLGATGEAEYVRNIIKDSLGVRKGTAAEGFMQSKIQISMKFDNLIQKVGGVESPQGYALAWAKNAPDLMYAALRNIYPNVLGFNPKAALMHTTVSLGRLAPEIGGTYGYEAMTKGMIGAASNFKALIERAESYGNMPAEFTRRGQRELAEGLMRSGVVQGSAETLKKVSDIGMIGFKTGERWNRALVIATGDVMAHDLLKGIPEAQQALTRFPRFVQQAVARAGTDESAIRAALGKYLNDTCMFNYNKMSMFEYGRSLGPILSTFSKWPTAIYGETLYTMRSQGLYKGALRSMERLAVPYAGLAAVDYLLFHKLPGQPISEDQDGPVQQVLGADRAKKIFGSQGFAGMAPVGALHEFTSGKTFTPPAVDILYNGIMKPALNGDTNKLSKGFDTALRSYTPYAGPFRFLTDDLMTYATGERPEGNTMLERAGSTLDRLTK